MSRQGLMGRFIFILVATMLGCYVGFQTGHAFAYSIMGLAVAVLMVLFEHITRFASSKTILFASLGATAGLIFSHLFFDIIRPAVSDRLQSTIPVLSHLFFGYLGVTIALRHADRFSFARLNFILSPTMEAEKILDTSMLIDSRILDLSQTNFLPGPFVVPQFVVQELQTLADSTNPVKRERGRRGLACLEELLGSKARVRIEERDFAGVTVDQKLVALSRESNAILMTVDYGLQKVAQIHQVRTINLNELANLLKSPTYVGDDLRVYVMREGKESSQGVGFLDDGSMVVVDNGRELIGTDAIVEVTSVIQTASGRMIFSRAHGEAPHPTPAHGAAQMSETEPQTIVRPDGATNGDESAARRQHQRRDGGGRRSRRARDVRAN